MERVHTHHYLSDEVLSGGVNSLEILQHHVTTALADLSMEGENDIDWRTLDLRIFRDVHSEGEDEGDTHLVRDKHLTIRATAVTKP